MTDRLVVLVDGPRWWGDPWQMPDGRPPRNAPAARAERRAAAEDELRGLQVELERLPEGTALIHTGARGAATQAAQWAATNGHVVGGFMAPDGDDGEARRNIFIADTIGALASLEGAKVKALLCRPPVDESGRYLGVVPEVSDTEELAKLLGDRKVFNRPVHPVAAPTEEPKAETPPGDA